jgi:amidophosphoribosyltransferase
MVLQRLAKRLDGAWNIVFLNALGDMVVARDPLGIRPLVYAKEGDLFAAASESVALTHLGFAEDSITSLQPGEAIIIQGPPPAGSPELTSEQRFRIERFAESPRKAHCFFEWIYFANVGSTLDERSVYLSRKHLGEELARVEYLEIDEDTVVVPVPDTAKAAADSMAFQLKVPSVEGLIRNRYIGRTFIEGTNRADKVRMKYTPLPEVLRGKKVILVEDSIVRSTTMMALLSQLRERGGAKEIHVRVACPPILSPCFYGIDMSTKNELFAARHMAGEVPTPEEEAKMARIIGADTLRYLPIESIARCVGIEADSLCQACVDSNYPTAGGQKLYQLALKQFGTADEPIAANRGRTYDTVGTRT